MTYKLAELVLNLWIICNLGCMEIECVFTPVVEISQGKLRGLRSAAGHQQYYGIPYAVSERFQPPRDPPPWAGVFTAAHRWAHCAQRVGPLALGGERCLQLDVHAPAPTPGAARPRPVMLFIHGGGYYYGTKAHYDPEFLVAKDVVVVVINYRVGVLGFLCAHGVANLGLWDQVAALKWVRKNILAFGGDPDNVTVAGQSAGASAAAMHMLSEASRGLFHKAILMSGTPLTPWAFNVEPLKPAFEDAGRLGNVTSEADIYRVFSAASVGDLLSACRDVSTNTRYFKYSPCVDANSTEPFFRDTPYNIIKSGRFNKVPIILGFAEQEGILFYGLNDDQTLKEWEDNFVDRLPSVISWCPEKLKQEIARELRAQYFGNKSIDRRQVRGIVDYYSDWLAFASGDTFTALMSEHSDQPIYRYVFAYEGGRNFAKFTFGQRSGLKGATHSDDIFYLFKPGGLPLPLSKADRLFIDRLTTMFTNFMKFGEPTPAEAELSWPAAGNGSGVLRLSRAPRPVRASSRARRASLPALLCAHARPGYLPCEPTYDDTHATLIDKF